MQVEKMDLNKHSIEDIKTILALAVGNPTPEKLQKLVDEYCISDSRTIYSAIQNDKIIGIIGIDCTQRPNGLISHLAVLQESRTQGIARHLIGYTAELLELTGIEAETDQDAVDFYRACGFETEEIESRYPGVGRFRCIKRYSR
ncbi:MAG: GNAT family N-acetyltransferase [Dehalococcoidales bacterium]